MTRQRARRMTATLLGLLLVQLTLAGTDGACRMHASHAVQDEVTDAHSVTHHSSEQQRGVSHVVPTHESASLGQCDVPCAPAPCGSAVTCGSTAASLTERDLSPATFASAAAVASDAAAPRSLAAAPETPPPRA